MAVSFFSLLIAIPALFGKNDIPFAFFAMTGICTVGLYLAYIIPVYLRLRAGDSFEPGPWNLGTRYRLVNTLAIVFVVLVVFSLNLPYTPTACPGTTGSTQRRQLHAAGDPRPADLRASGTWSRPRTSTRDRSAPWRRTRSRATSRRRAGRIKLGTTIARRCGDRRRAFAIQNGCSGPAGGPDRPGEPLAG